MSNPVAKIDSTVQKYSEEQVKKQCKIHNVPCQTATPDQVKEARNNLKGRFEHMLKG